MKVTIYKYHNRSKFLIVPSGTVFPPPKKPSDKVEKVSRLGEYDLDGSRPPNLNIEECKTAIAEHGYYIVNVTVSVTETVMPSPIVSPKSASTKRK